MHSGAPPPQTACVRACVCAACLLHLQMIGVVVVMVAIPIIATEKADAKWVFTAFDGSVAHDSGIKNNL